MSISRRSGNNKEKLMAHQYELLFSKEQSDLLSAQPDYWETFFTMMVTFFSCSLSLMIIIHSFPVAKLPVAAIPSESFGSTDS